MNRIKNSGPIILPCGTPCFNITSPDSFPRTWSTTCFLLHRYERHQLSSWLATPYAFNFLNKSSWSTMSNAFRWSTRTMPDTLSLSRLNNSPSIILIKAVSSWVSVLCFLRNPNGLEYIRLFSLRKSYKSWKWRSIIFDKKLEGSHSNPFLNKGVTLAVFQREGNFSLEKDCSSRRA